VLLALFAAGLIASTAATGTFTSLRVFKTHSPDTGTLGAPLTYEVTVTNIFTDPVDAVTLTDELPSGLTLDSGSAGCSGTTIVTCSLGTLDFSTPAGTVTLVVTPTAPGPVTNVAYASGDECGDGCIATSPAVTDVAVVVTATPPPPAPPAPPPPPPPPPPAPPADLSVDVTRSPAGAVSRGQS
jgi:uncharacterized repeat protein (TIGR01451 family)